MRVLIVAGSDTEVGKTVVTAALAALALARGERVGVVKPVQTGVAPGERGDVEEIRRLARIEDVHELARFQEALAPASAARVAGRRPPTIDEAAAAIEQLRDRDLVLVEGSGGVLVHLDARGGTLVDLACALNAPVLVVVRAGLGTLNHTALTCEALRTRGVRCNGIVVGAWPAEPDLAATCNFGDLPLYAGVPLVGRLPEDASALDPEAFLAAAREGLSAEVLGKEMLHGPR